MAIPPTGSTITMTDLRDFFVGGGFASSFVLGILGTYIGISQGTTITMSSTFGGFGQSSTPGSFSLVSTSPTLSTINPTSEGGGANHIAFDEWNGVAGEYMFVSGSSFGAYTCGVVNVATGAELFTFSLSSSQDVIIHPTGIQSNDLIFKIISSTTTGPIIYHYNHSGNLVRSIGPISGQTLNNFGDVFYNPNNGRYYGLNEASANSFYGIRKFNTSTTPEASFAIPNPIDGFTWDRQFTVRGQVCPIPNKNAILYTVLFTNSSTGLYKYATLSFDMDDEQWYVIAGSPADPSGSIPRLTSPFDGVTAATEIFDQCLSSDGTTLCVGLKQGTSSVWYNGYVDPTAQWEFSSPVNLDAPDLQTAGTNFFTNRSRYINTVYGDPGAFVESFQGSTFDTDPEPGRGWLYSRATSFEFSTFTIIESISGDDLPTFPPSPTYMPRFYPIYDTTTGPKKLVRNGTSDTQTMMCGGASSTNGASTSNDKVYRINVPTVGGSA